jgi:hypothetical protein
LGIDGSGAVFKTKNPAAPAVKREEEDWAGIEKGRGRRVP